MYMYLNALVTHWAQFPLLEANIKYVISQYMFMYL